MLTPKSHFPAVVFDGRIYVFSGVKQNLNWILDQPKLPPLSSIEVYDPKLQGEIVKDDGKIPKTWGTLKAK